MSRRRYISTEMSTDSRINRLAATGGDFAVLMYTWLIPHAKDDGTVRGDPEELLLQVFPGRRDKDASDVITALRQMETLKLVVWNAVANTVTFPAETFYRHQTYIKPANRRGSENNAAKRRETPQNTGTTGKGHASTANVRRDTDNVRRATHTTATPSLDVSDEEGRVVSALSEILPKGGPKPERQKERFVEYCRQFSEMDALAVADNLVAFQLQNIAAAHPKTKPYTDIASAFRDRLQRDKRTGHNLRAENVHPQGNGNGALSKPLEERITPPDLDNIAFIKESDEAWKARRQTKAAH